MTEKPHTSFGGFDIRLQEQKQERYFLAFIPQEQTLPISISEHWSWNASEESRRHACGQYSDAVRVLPSRERWSQIADGVQTTFNARLKRSGKRMARWKKVSTPLSWKYGRDGVILA